MVRLLTLSALTLVFLLGSGSSGSATPIPITDLVDRHLTITQGDKLFSDFSVIFNAQGSGITTPPDASGILVDGITIGANHGLAFTGNMSAGPNASLDILIKYTVTALDPGLLISDIDLSFDGAVTGTGFTIVTETVTKPDEITVLGQAQVYNPPPVFSSIVDLTEPVRVAVVKKDIFLFGGPNGTATISFVDQAVSQTPEPASLFLLGAGLLGLLGFGARRLR